MHYIAFSIFSLTALSIISATILIPIRWYSRINTFKAQTERIDKEADKARWLADAEKWAAINRQEAKTKGITNGL